ncbi:hypothetical protein SAMN05444365_101747 [Micromonospora pattaloongensis]|uniref:Uncharacterized protein n=2 Tax=Micromonospora pattaloongensis TaxID=405436 RepID=A0A1H3HC27_9ACTN|nr:hypothetical protein SAMN05444365_101747 [Micromonospora pattaloongensis]
MAQPPMRSEHTPGPPPAIPMPVGAPMPPGRRLRLTLAIVGGMVLLLCMGGVGISYALYDNATAPDRSAPDVVVDNYLRALLVERNDTNAALYACDEPALEDIKAFREDVIRQEARLNTSITFSWGQLTVQSGTGGEAEVTTTVRRSGTIDGAGQSVVDVWTFRAVDQNGWRVCGAQRRE